MVHLHTSFLGTHQIQNETGPTHWSQFNMKAKGSVKPESKYESSLFQRLPHKYIDRVWLKHYNISRKLLFLLLLVNHLRPSQRIDDTFHFNKSSPQKRG